MDLKFKKYFSIENSYRKKEIAWWLENFPKLKDERYIITEKLHGSNIQIIFNVNKKMIVCCRNGVLEKNNKFYGILNVLKKYKYDFDIIQNYVNESNKSLSFYCELYGAGVNKGVNYGRGKKIALFDCRGEKYFSQKYFLYLLNSLNIAHLYVPFLGITNNLEEALNFNVEFNSKILNVEDNKAEGIVIKTYDRPFCNGDGELFYLKKKSCNFKERSHKKKIRAEISNSILEIREIFKEYINDNRLQCVFSKEGRIEKKEQIGKYISLLMSDAKKDFASDNGDKIKDLCNVELKQIYNVGNIPFLLINEYV